MLIFKHIHTIFQNLFTNTNRNWSLSLLCFRFRSERYSVFTWLNFFSEFNSEIASFYPWCFWLAEILLKVFHNVLHINIWNHVRWFYERKTKWRFHKYEIRSNLNFQKRKLVAQSILSWKRSNLNNLFCFEKLYSIFVVFIKSSIKVLFWFCWLSFFLEYKTSNQIELPYVLFWRCFNHRI